MRSINLFQFTSDTLPYAFCEQIGKEIRDISDEIPFKIPDSWEWVRLGVISSLVTKGTTPRGGNVSYLDSGIGFLKAENVAGMDVLDTSKMNYIDEETHNGFLKRSILYENDLLITIAGTLGRTAIVRKHNLPLNANQAVSIIRLVDSNEFDLMYLICALNSPLIQKMLTKQKKITAIPNLTLEIISDCFIPIPPLSEQKRIVAKIEGLLPFIEKYEQAETKLTALNKSFPEMLKKSILQEAVQGKLVPQNPDDEPASVLLERIRTEKQELIKQGKIKKSKHESIIVTRDKIPYEIINGKERCIADEVPFEIPESWEWCRLTELSSVITKGSSPKWQGITYVDEKNGILFITSENIGKEKLLMNKAKYVEKKFNDMHSTSILKFGDILTNIVGASIGRTAIYNLNSENSNINQAVCIIRLINLDFRMYIIKFLNSPIAFQMMTNNSVDSARANLSLSSVSNFLIPLPPLAEQKRIVEKIEELMTFCEKLK